MELKQLASLVAIAEHGSLSRAAVALNLAQPSLSRQMALLEASVGQRLFERHGRGVAPTAAGQALLVHARDMLAHARRARDELAELSANPSGRVTVGLPPRVALGLSAPLVRGFRQRFPRATITVLEGLSLALREQLIAGRLDMALLFDPQPTTALRFEPLMRERLLLVAPPGSRLPPRVALAALPSYPMVLPSAPNAIRGLIDQVLRPRGLVLDVLAEVGAVHTVLALVAQGLGATLLPESALADAAFAHLPRAAIGPPAVWNALVLAVPLARPADRMLRETQVLLKGLDFRRPAEPG